MASAEDDDHGWFGYLSNIVLVYDFLYKKIDRLHIRILPMLELECCVRSCVRDLHISENNLYSWLSADLLKNKLEKRSNMR